MKYFLFQTVTYVLFIFLGYQLKAHDVKEAEAKDFPRRAGVLAASATKLWNAEDKLKTCSSDLTKAMAMAAATVTATPIQSQKITCVNDYDSDHIICTGGKRAE